MSNNTYICSGGHFWGSGKSLGEAIIQWVNAGGKLREQRISVVRMPEGAEHVRVSSIDGAVHWQGGGEPTTILTDVTVDEIGPAHLVEGQADICNASPCPVPADEDWSGWVEGVEHAVAQVIDDEAPLFQLSSALELLGLAIDAVHTIQERRAEQQDKAAQG